MIKYQNSVAEDFGFDSNLGSSVKLVYIKYLDVLDKWLQKVGESKDQNGGVKDSGVFSMDLESDFRGLVSGILDQKKKDSEYLHVDLKKSELNVIGVENLGNGDDKRGFDELKDDMVLESSEVKEDDSNRKRKRECYLGMLNWVTEVAKEPCDPAIGSLPERSKWKCYGNEELWKQVLLVREEFFLKTSSDSSAEQLIWQKKQKMHPTMYDDHSGSERLRCSQRLRSSKESQILSLKKSRGQTFSESSSSGTQSDPDDHFDKPSDLFVADSLWGNYNKRKKVPLGPLFQAEVPEWAGETFDSDSKWLGTRVWPLEKREQNKYLIERDPIGKGRQDSCGCQFPGSVECVRFHVSEKRMKVKLELGLGFHHWKFDKMGDEVGLFWTTEEQKKFQDIVRSNPLSLDKCFWEEMFKSFPRKSKQELVRYYFNVFLLRCRGYQNRSSSSNIDSDDDESEFASSIKGFEYEAVKSSGSILRTPKKAHLKSR